MRPQADPILHSIVTRWWTGAVGGLFFGVLALAFDMAGLAELVSRTPGAVVPFLIGAMFAFLPIAIAVSIGWLAQASDYEE